MRDVVWMPIEVKAEDLKFKLYMDRVMHRFNITDSFYVPAKYFSPKRTNKGR